MIGLDGTHTAAGEIDGCTISTQAIWQIVYEINLFSIGTGLSVNIIQPHAFAEFRFPRIVAGCHLPPNRLRRNVRFTVPRVKPLSQTRFQLDSHKVLRSPHNDIIANRQRTDGWNCRLGLLGHATLQSTNQGAIVCVEYRRSLPGIDQQREA